MSIANIFRNLDWASTARLAIIRAAAASLVWIIILLIAGSAASSDENPLYLYFVFFAGILLFLLPVTLLFYALSRGGVPFAGLVSNACSLVVIVGDPIVWVLNQFKPEWINVEKLGFFNPSFLLVYKQESVIPDELR